MPYIPTETIISAAILAALIAGWRYVQQNPQQELIPASVKKTAQSALSNGKGLFEDELTGESSKKAKAGGKKSGSSKKKSKGGAGSTAPVKAISETEGEQETSSASPVEVKSTKQKKPQTLAEKKVKKAPKTEVDDMLPDDQKQPHLARVMKIVPEPTSSTSYSAVAAPHPSDDPSTSAPVASPAQGKTDSSSEEGRKEEFGYEDEDESEEEGRKEEDDGWEVPKKFVGGSNASSFASAAASSRAPSAPTLNRFSLLTDSNPNFQSSSSSRRKTTSSTSRSTQPEQSATPTKIQRKNANKRDAQKAQKEQEEKERLDRLKSYRAEAAKDRAGAGGKKDAMGRGVENWSSQREVTPYPPSLPITLDSVVRFLKKTILSPRFAMNIQAGFFLWRKFAPAGWKDRFDLDGHVELQFWLKRYGYAIATLSAFRSAKEILTGQLWPTQIKWKKQIVVVTGGASGIGALLVQAMAKKGAKVVVLDINRATETTDLISSYICDVSNYTQVQDIAERIRAEVGSPTILVNNAGVVAGKMILDLQERDIQRTFGVNVLSHFWTIKAFLPDMLESKRGHIVTVSSVLGLAGSARMTDYCASKAALITMHDALRFELTNRYHAPGIKTTLLLPGHIRTPLFDRIQFPRSLFFRFMAPSLQPEEVVAGIMNELYHQRDGVVRMPFYTQTVRLLNIGTGLVPGVVRNFLQWLSQADYAMDSYN